jgi:type VI secretion system protein ImpA
MPFIDIDKLLKEVSTEFPCGRNLEYDPPLNTLKETAEGQPPRQMGNSIVAGKDPDWPSVHQQCVELFLQTKDIRVTVYLIKALLHLHHLPGFAVGVVLLRTLLEKYWDGIHPQLDQNDNNDPTQRLNNLKELNNPLLLNSIRSAPLVMAPGLGSCCIRDIERLSAPADRSANMPTTAAIKAIFNGCNKEELQTTVDSIKKAVEDVAAIESYVNQKVSKVHAFSLGELSELLIQGDKMLREHFTPAAKADDKAGSANAEALQSKSKEIGPNIEGKRLMENRHAGGPGVQGEISSREDVIVALDKVYEYYQQYEPSSPVPLLIQRSKRLVFMNFVDIVREIAPAGLKEVEAIRGAKDDGTK